MIYYIGIIIKNKTRDYKLMFLYKKIKQERKDCMNFEYAKITRSRLMGSMGLVIKHSDNESEIFEYYLLDCEGQDFVIMLDQKIQQKKKRIWKKKD